MAVGRLGVLSLCLAASVALGAAHAQAQTSTARTSTSLSSLVAAPALARPDAGRNGPVQSDRSLPLTTSLIELGESRMPIGWMEFCLRYADECAAEPLQPQVATLNAKTWARLVLVNARVNAEIVPITDMEHWGVAERWDYPTDGKGDCEDYALEKRKRLIQAGLPRQSLLITVVRDQRGDGHAVLTIKTDRGDFILDNQEASIVSWADTGYRMIKRQSQEDPNRWVALGDPTPLTASRQPAP